MTQRTSTQLAADKMLEDAIFAVGPLRTIELLITFLRTHACTNPETAATLHQRAIELERLIDLGAR